jgi:hypothetical protein
MIGDPERLREFTRATVLKFLRFLKLLSCLVEFISRTDGITSNLYGCRAGVEKILPFDLVAWQDSGTQVCLARHKDIQGCPSCLPSAGPG